MLLLALLVLVMLVGTPVAPAQCFGPDGLDLGPCCASVLPTLPPFPGASLPGLGACWDRCTQGLQRTLKVSWNAPAQPFCGEYTTPLVVSDATSGLPILTGKLLLDYTRTWQEIDPAGNTTQVWRFTAKADLSSVPGGLVVNCPQPPCITPVGPHGTAFYYGYVDYASCSGAGPWENVLVLFHNCDRFIHAPGLSDRPGVFHPGQSYAIIAPHSNFQPFVPGNTIAGGGPIFGEAVRDMNTSSPPPNPCTVEDRIAAGTMTPLGAGCVCALTANPKQQTLRQFQGQTTCPGTSGAPGGWTSLNVNFPNLPWFHMVTSSIGSWSNPNVYPGNEFAWVDEGIFVHQAACTGDFVEIKYGGTTRGGWTAVLPIPVLVTQFTDLVDNYTAPLFGPYPFPVLGSIRPSDHLIYVNEP
jgi:hypothetical protein